MRTLKCVIDRRTAGRTARSNAIRRAVLFFACGFLLLGLTGCDNLFRKLLPVPDRPSNAVQTPALADLFPSAITTTGALIVWRTEKPAGSRVNYGKTTSLGTEITDTTSVVQHSVALTGLSAGTKYYFTATSFDPMGNVVTSAQQSFTTETLGTDALGPQVSGISVTPSPTAGATAISVSAVVSDASSGGSNITAAECFIDSQGSPGTGTALTAQDGVFNSVTENVNGVIPVTGRSAGGHTLYIRGRDASNNWGAFQAIPVTISAGSGGDALGPLSSGSSVTPNPTGGAASATVNATVSDASTGGANVTAAEYFIDTQGASGTGTALAAKDGAFNSPAEVVTGSLNLSGLAPGTHTVYVHGKDALNNWGGAQSVSLSVTASGGVKPDAASIAAVHYALSFSGQQPQEAIWIEDALGNFVRTLFISNHASGSSSDLPTWYAKSGGQTDGTTGASKNAGSFNAAWAPPRSSAGSVVAPGSYRYRIAVRQQGGAESAYTGNITLGGSAASSTGTSGNQVTSLSADYTP